MRLLCYVPFLLLFFSLPLQSQEALPKILPATINPLKGENDPTGYCFSNLVFDTTGRLWMKTCGVAAQLYALQVLQYDGYDHRPINVTRAEWKDYLVGYLEGTTADGKLYGYLNKKFDQPTLYLYDIADGSITYTPLPIGMVGGIEEYQPGKFWVLSKTETAFNIYHWDKKILKHYFTIPNDTHYDEERKIYYKEVNDHFIYADSTLWFMDKNLPVIAIDLATKTINKYDNTSFSGSIDNPIPFGSIYETNSYLIVKGDKAYVLYSYFNDQPFELEWKGEEQIFKPMNIFPEGAKGQSIWKDKQGNLLFLFEYKGTNKGKTGAYLLDTSNQLFDYSAIIANLPYIYHVGGDNFKERGVYRHS